jgi:large subunit ribosomal protein L9
MKVLLKEDVDNLGYAGEVHSVADGFGRNYLIPKGFAVIATPSVMQQADIWRKKAEARREELRAEYEQLSEKINATTLTYIARAGETGKLYGSITTSQITDDLNEKLGTDIDRRKVGVEPLRQLGDHQVIVRLSADFQPYVTVVIEPEEGSPAQLHLEEAAAEVVEVEEVEDIETFEEEVDKEVEEDDFDEYDDFMEEEIDI